MTPQTKLTLPPPVVEMLRELAAVRFVTPSVVVTDLIVAAHRALTTQRPGTPTPSHATGPATQPPGIPKRPPFEPRKIDGKGKHLIGGPEHRALLIWRIAYADGVRNVDGSPVPTMPEDEATRYVDEVMLPNIVANTPEQLRMPAEVVEAERAQTALWIKQMEARE
jgi:hypothetical protein